MGKKNRERIQRILNGEEQSIRDQNMNPRGLGIKDKIVSRIEGVTRKIVEKTLAPKWMKMDLKGQVAVATKMVRTTGIVNFRSNFLKPGNFPSDVQDKRKEGWSDGKIREYYWGCPEWVVFWKNLELNEDHFAELLKQ